MGIPLVGCWARWRRMPPGLSSSWSVGVIGRSVSGQLELMAHLSRWLAEQDAEPDGLTPTMAERFLEVRREADVSLRSWRALDPLVGYLRGLGVVPKLAA